MFYLGSFSNMKRNQAKLHDNMLVLLQERKEAAKERKTMIEMMTEMRREIKILHYNNNNETISVVDMFPATSQQEIEAFMDNSDGKFKARLNGFYEYLFGVCAPTKKKFQERLKTHLFTDEYCEKHHWPNIV